MANGKNNKKKLSSNKITNFLKGAGVYFLIGLAAFIFFINTSGGGKLENEVPISSVVQDVKDNKIEKLTLEGDKVIVVFKERNRKAVAHKESGESIYKILESSGVDPKSVTIEVKDTSWQQAIIGLLGALLPVILMVGLLFFLFRQAREAGQSIFSFGQSRAKMYSKDQPQIKFTDVAGVEEAKKELEEVVDFLKNPQKYKEIGARTPKGVLLVGPPGCGKTLLARSVAGEAGVPFFSIAGSEFMEILVGVGASVTGDTPILIKDHNRTCVISIGQFVDQYYKQGEERLVKNVEGVEALGFERRRNNFYGTRSENHLIFDHSAWKKVQGVYRHKVNEIYEIEYLGGQLRTTRDHSVFIRTHGRIITKKVSELVAGDLLVELPLNVRFWDYENKRTVHIIKSHNFSSYNPFYLDFWNDDQALKEKYGYVLQNVDLSSYMVANQIGVSQTTVLNWRKGKHLPQLLSKKLVKLDLPDRVLVTPKLMKLFGYYTAEGRGTGSLEFTFGSHEPTVYQDCIRLMSNVFGVKPVLLERPDHSVKINYYSHHLGRFFGRFCGNGSHNKHVPHFIWDLPKEYFLAFLEGYSKGDGYITKSGKLSMSSASHQLIRELSWLCSMHGIKVGIKHAVVKGGRIIKDKPLPDGEYWILIIGRTANPFLPQVKYPNQFKRAIVRKITKRTYDGYVYDLCGVENEAFFGGEKPVLLHNSRVRDLFLQAKKSAPSIIFVDEIESIGRMRGLGISGGHDEREQTLNQILVEMDGFTPNDNLVILAATNRPDMLDPALIRPGRFDRRVVLGLPDLEERKAIIQLHMKGKPFTQDVDTEKLARRTVSFSGADIANMLNEAAIMAAREGKSVIDPHHLEEAATKEKLGPRRQRMQTDEDRKLAAYHEAGHAVVGHFSKNIDPIHRISIVSRGISGGHTMFPPSQDRANETKSRLLDQIVTALGGQAAEKMIFNDTSTGAASDLEIATNIAKAMVMDYGMSDIGPITSRPKSLFSLWMRMPDGDDGISSQLKNQIDIEIRKILDQSYKKAQTILTKNKAKLEKVAKALLDKETLESEEFESIVGKKH